MKHIECDTCEFYNYWRDTCLLENISECPFEEDEEDGYSAREGLDYIESYINTLSNQQVEEPVPAKLGAEHLKK